MLLQLLPRLIASSAGGFQFYGYLSQQQNMLQDYVRTATYQNAIISNLPDFKGKVRGGFL